MDYRFRQRPFDHQLREFLSHRENRIRALFWEMGTGKSKTAIDQACWLYLQKAIDALVIVAPSGVHSNWSTITDNVRTAGELQKHIPEEVNWQCFTFYSSKASSKRYMEKAQWVLNYEGLAILAISYDGALTPTGKRTLWNFLSKRRSMIIADESVTIKTPGAARTRTLLKAATYAPYRRILTGTPMETPFDVYAQVRFLDGGFWARRGFRTFQAFKSHFALLETYQQDPSSGRWLPVESKDFVESKDWKFEEVAQEVFDYEDSFEQYAGAGLEGQKVSNGVPFIKSAPHFTKIVEYRNLDELRNILAPISTRVLKDDVLDLPPKLYQMRYFEMTKDQRRIYEEIKEEALSWLNSEQYTTAILPIVRLLRLQQVTNGFVTPDGETNPALIGDKNPRLDLMREIADEVGKGNPHIVYARFQMDIDLVSSALRKDGFRVAVYDGRTTDDDREQIKIQFQEGKIDKLVANQAAAGEGLTLTSSRRTTYYSNSFRLRHRLQSEDRNHRVGQSWSVLYDDICCPGTIDFKLIEALRNKIDITSEALGDKLRGWLI